TNRCARGWGACTILSGVEWTYTYVRFFVFEEPTMSLRSELKAAGHQAGGSFKTKANREAAVGRFCSYLQANNLQVSSIAKMKTSHLERYAKDMLLRDLAARTVQSELSALRSTLTAAGREKLGRNVSNNALGIARASRAGTRTAMGAAKFAEVRRYVGRRDGGVAACIELQRALGLRAKEAIMSQDSLGTWATAIARGNPCKIIRGTKGGRARDVRPVNVAAAQAAIAQAQNICEKNGGKLFSGRSLKSAMARYHNVMHAAGATGTNTGHSLRYAFARDQFEDYIGQGLTRREALAATALDLGHGDGRGRWVERVYLR
ncbi:MAG: integrase domain-containing protein, partial [Gammaproteobacteria bacterium]